MTHEVTDVRSTYTLIAKRVGGKLSEGTGKRRTGETWDDWEYYGPLGITVDGVTHYPLTSNQDALWLAARLKLTTAAYETTGDPEQDLRTAICLAAEGLQTAAKMLTIPNSLYCQTCKAFTLHELRDPDVCCTECATIAVTME